MTAVVLHDRHRAAASPARSRVLTRAVPVVLAAVAALAQLGRQPLWFDEVATARASALSWSGLRVLLGRTDANIGLYYALLHGWQVVGHSAADLRLPSALATIGTVVLTERVGRRLIGPRPAIVAAGLLAVAPFATAYAHDARPYALVALCCTAALLLGLRAVERPSTGRLAAYAAVGALAICLHLYAVLVVAAYGLALLPADGPPRRRWLRTHLAVLPVALVMLAVSLRQSVQLGWVPALSAGRVLSGLALLCGGIGPLVAVGGALGLVAAGRTAAMAGTGRRVLLLGVLLPVGCLLAASLVSPTFVPRYLIATVPLQCLALAAAGLRVRLGRAVLVVVAVWFAVTTVVQLAAPYRYEDYRAAGQALLAGERPGDGVVYEQNGARLGLEYYLPDAHRPNADLSGARPVDVLARPGAALQGFTVPVLTGSAASAALAGYRRVWVVRHLDVPAAPVAGLSPFRCAPSSSFGLVALQLCSRSGA